ncbi:MAG: hypothetical protein H6707_19830 [Deltaproteobacteria bacterium]|nr:hypothetical protein [Deltaproteobacteria bacterium]
MVVTVQRNFGELVGYVSVITDVATGTSEWRRSSGNATLIHPMAVLTSLHLCADPKTDSEGNFAYDLARETIQPEARPRGCQRIILGNRVYQRQGPPIFAPGGGFFGNTNAAVPPVNHYTDLAVIFLNRPVPSPEQDPSDGVKPARISQVSPAEGNTISLAAFDPVSGLYNEATVTVQTASGRVIVWRPNADGSGELTPGNSGGRITLGTGNDAPLVGVVRGPVHSTGNQYAVDITSHRDWIRQMIEQAQDRLVAYRLQSGESAEQATRPTTPVSTAICNSGATRSCGECGTQQCVDGEWSVCSPTFSCGLNNRCNHEARCVANVACDSSYVGQYRGCSRAKAKHPERVPCGWQFCINGSTNKQVAWSNDCQLPPQGYGRGADRLCPVGQSCDPSTLLCQ